MSSPGKGRSFVLAALLLPLVSSCGVTSLIRTNTRAIGTNTRSIEESSATMRKNAAILQHSNRAMETMAQRLDALEDPMRRVGELRGPLRDVASLEAPMRDLSRLERPMQDVGALREPMEKVSALEPSMRTLASLAEDTSGRNLAGLGLGALAAWGGVTFLGVYCGFRAGLRSARRKRAGARGRAPHRK